MNDRVADGLVKDSHVSAVIAPYVADVYWDDSLLVVTYKASGERPASEKVHCSVIPGYVGKSVAVEIANRVGVDAHLMFGTDDVTN